LTWSEALLALLVSHVAGDVLFQTDSQARHKGHGAADPQRRRALGSHLTTYMLAFVPALVWIALETSAIRAVAVAVLVATTHLAIDDGRLVRIWLRDVKLALSPSPALSVAVDQSFHVLCLFGAALVAAG
jgi:hypothetical protein